MIVDEIKGTEQDIVITEPVVEVVTPPKPEVNTISLDEVQKMISSSVKKEMDDFKNSYTVKFNEPETKEKIKLKI